MINVDELRLILKLNGVDVDSYTDEDLEHIIDYYVRKFNSMICFTYTQKDRQDYFNKEVFNSLLLNHYPVRNLISITVNDKNVYDSIDYFNYSAGTIYFKKHFIGKVKVHYRSGFSDNDIETLIVPLIIDLIVYGMKYDCSEGVISSLHEGDVSVTYDTSEKGYLSIQSRISDLNRKFCQKARML